MRRSGGMRWSVKSLPSLGDHPDRQHPSCIYGYIRLFLEFFPKRSARAEAKGTLFLLRQRSPPVEGILGTGSRTYAYL